MKLRGISRAASRAGDCCGMVPARPAWTSRPPRMTATVPRRRLLHAVVVLLAAGYAMYQVDDCVTRFLSEPVASQRDTFHAAQLPTPGLTLCNHLLDMLTVDYLIDKSTNKQLADLPWDEFGNDTIPTLLRTAAVDTETALSSCQLRGRPCAAVGSWSRRLHSFAGDCFTFTPNTSEPLQIGGGFEITFLLARSTYTDIRDMIYVLNYREFRVVHFTQGEVSLSLYVHEAGEPFSVLPWIQHQEPVAVRPGVLAEVRVAMDVIERVSRRHLPCESRPGYSRVQCSLLCHAEAAAATTGLDCRVTDMPTSAPLCGNFANYSAVQRAFTTAAGARSAMESCHQRCPKPCRQRLYRASQQKNYGNDDRGLRQFAMRVYYLGEETHLYREQWSYGVSALVGEAGGVVGLMLGLSVLSVFEAARELADDLFKRLTVPFSTHTSLC